MLQNDGRQALKLQRVEPGLHMISHSNLNDLNDPRVRWFKDGFEHTAPPTNPAILSHWQPWAALMAVREGENPADPLTGLRIQTDFGFETRSTALLALDRQGNVIWWHGESQFEDEKLSHFHKVLG